MNKPFYKQKLIIIEIVDGRKIEIDFSQFQNMRDDKGQLIFPIGYDLPPSHAVYRQVIISIGTGGFTDVENSTDDHYIHIAPSQIKNVQLKWVADETQLLTVVD